MSVNDVIMDALKANNVGFVTTVPCKQLAGVIEKIDQSEDMIHVPSNREDEGMGLCAGAFMGGRRPAIIMQNTAIGVTINALTTLIQYYRMPLPMLISYRGKALLAQLNIPTYHFHHPDDAAELSGILNHAYMARKPVAVLMDATFWKGQ